MLVSPLCVLCICAFEEGLHVIGIFRRMFRSEASEMTTSCLEWSMALVDNLFQIFVWFVNKNI